MLIDVHAHLDFPQFDSDRKQVIENAKREGILIINSGIGPEGIEKTISLARKYDNVFATLGLSPREFRREIVEETMELVRKYRNDILGIGEVGLDYHWVKDSKGRREELENFNRFVELSRELKLPLVVHSRDAEVDVINRLKEGDIPALLHSFSGDLKLAEEAVSFDCLISIPASVVYSKQKQKMVKHLPLESIVMETDAPYLSPKPGTRNEPVNLKLTRDMIAEIKGVDKGIVEGATTENAERFFDLRL
jgi:TatD DNase family protein